MFEGYSQKALQAIETAKALAIELGDQSVATGHLIYGLTVDESSCLHHIFKDLSVDPDMFSGYVKSLPREPEVDGPDAPFNRHVTTVLERGAVFASQIGLPGRWRLIHELRQRGVELVSNAQVGAIQTDHVEYTVDGDERRADGDVVLVAECSSDTNAGVAVLEGAGVPVHAIGDCTGAGYIEGAMLDAATVAVAL